MTNADFQAYPSEIELLAIECDRDSILTISRPLLSKRSIAARLLLYAPRA